MTQTLVDAVSAAAMNIAKDLLLDLLDSGRDGLEPLDALIILAVLQANRALGALSDVAPADGAPADPRPVSVSGLAASLQSPFETVRRRVARLSGLGIFEVAPTGVVAPRWVLESPGYAKRVLGVDRSLCQAYRRLLRVGFFEGDSRPQPALSNTAPAPMAERAVLSGAFTLRMMDFLGARFGGIVRVMVMLAMLRENTRDLGDARNFGDGVELPVAPDSLKRPASVALVARRLRLQHETVRRHVHALVSQGVCRRVRGGFIVTAQSLVQRRLAELVPETSVNLHRLYRGLGQIGAIAAWGYWDGEGARPDGL